MTPTAIIEEQHGIIERQNDIIRDLFSQLAQHISVEEQEELCRRYEIEMR